MMNNLSIRGYTQEYLAERQTPVADEQLDVLVADVHRKMLELGSLPGRDAVREALAAVLTIRNIRAFLGNDA